jgi:hypothetical protein
MKYRLWIIGLPLFIGLALACAGIPFFDVGLMPVCWVDSLLISVLLLSIPISIVIFFATAIMFMIYLKEYHQERRVRRWIVGSNVQSLPRKVFWQGFWYLMCFYVSWPMVLIFLYIEKGNYYSAFGFFCTAVFVFPLQGFLNCIAYARKRALRCMKPHNMWSCSYTAYGFQRLAATSVDFQHELKESNIANNSMAGLEAASFTVTAEKQAVDS